jgi:hypothetical protein
MAGSGADLVESWLWGSATTVETINSQVSGGKPLRIFEITLVTYAY